MSCPFDSLKPGSPSSVTKSRPAASKAQPYGSGWLSANDVAVSLPSCVPSRAKIPQPPGTAGCPVSSPATKRPLPPGSAHDHAVHVAPARRVERGALDQHRLGGRAGGGVEVVDAQPVALGPVAAARQRVLRGGQQREPDEDGESLPAAHGDRRQARAPGLRSHPALVRSMLSAAIAMSQSTRA